MKLTKLGRYNLVGVLGNGAMGFVYEGFDPNLKRRVAIKTIKAEHLSELAAQEYEIRFRTEAHSAARLQHPNIVSVYDSDRDDGVAFLVMEFVDGKDLKHHLDTGTLYSLEQTVSIMVALLSALDYAHSQNIVHRDVKPANLLITSNGQIKLTDFGVARIQNSGDATRTQGTVVGTLKYMSPEQIQGLPVDARADLFAAGVVMYQLLTGTRPFDADTYFGVIQKVVLQIPESATALNTQLPPAIDLVVARSLAKSRDDRYSSAAEFSLALTNACRDTGALKVVPTIESLRYDDHSKPISLSGSGGPASRTMAKTLSNTSIVAQEIELVYWKEIKDTIDIRDIDDFLVQFPAGIYAALAQRRKRQLSDPTAANTQVRDASGALTHVVPLAEHSARDDEQTKPLTTVQSAICKEEKSVHGLQTMFEANRPLGEQITAPTTLVEPVGNGLTQAPGSNVSVSAEALEKRSGEGLAAHCVEVLFVRQFYYRWSAGLVVLLGLAAAIFGLQKVDGSAPSDNSQNRAILTLQSKSPDDTPAMSEQLNSSTLLKPTATLRDLPSVPLQKAGVGALAEAPRGGAAEANTQREN
jgi:serine/threonine protein kinase